MPAKPTIKPLKFVKVRDVCVANIERRALSEGEAKALLETFGQVCYKHEEFIYICNRKVVDMKEFRAMTGMPEPAPEPGPEQFRL